MQPKFTHLLNFSPVEFNLVKPVSTKHPSPLTTVSGNSAVWLSYPTCPVALPTTSRDSHAYVSSLTVVLSRLLPGHYMRYTFSDIRETEAPVSNSMATSLPSSCTHTDLGGTLCSPWSSTESTPLCLCALLYQTPNLTPQTLDAPSYSCAWLFESTWAYSCFHTN